MIIIGRKCISALVYNIIGAVLSLTGIILLFNINLLYVFIIAPVLIYSFIRIFMYLRMPKILIYIEEGAIKIFTGSKYETVQFREIREIVEIYARSRFKELEYGILTIYANDKSYSTQFVAHLFDVKNNLLKYKEFSNSTLPPSS